MSWTITGTIVDPDGTPSNGAIVAIVSPTPARSTSGKLIDNDRVAIPVSGGQVDDVALESVPGASWTFLLPRGRRVEIADPGDGSVVNLAADLPAGVPLTPDEASILRAEIARIKSEGLKGDKGDTPQITWEGTRIVVDGDPGPDIIEPVTNRAIRAEDAATQAASSAAATKQLAASMVGPTDAGVAQLVQSGPSTRAALRAFSDTAARSASTASTLRATTDKVGISVVSSTRWRLRAQVAANQVWSQDLALIPAGSYVGPSQPPMLLDAATLAVASPAPPNTLGTPTWVDETDASVTHTGTTYQWQNVTADSRAYGGGYRFTLTAGEYVNWTTPAGTVHVVASVVANINGGYGLVEIDGSKTAATSLPTAQDEVTAGRLTSTALVANGGTLNPTDRLLNFYSASSLWDDRRVLATGLATGAHTVRITCTGYKQGTAAAARIFSSGFGAAGYAATGTPTTTTTTLFPQGSAYSAYEYAIDVESADGSQHDFVGNVHGYDKPSSITVYVDGAQVDMTQAGADYSGSDVTIIRDSTISSPYLTGDVATARVMYRLTRDGLEVRTRLTFAQACKLRGGYTAMYPVADSLKRGVIVGQPGVLDLSKGTGGAAGGVRAYSQAAYVYDPASGVTACMWLPDLSGVGTYAATSTSQGGMFIEDRTGSVINKIYASFVSADVKRSVTAGEVITGRTIYRAMQLPDPTMLNPAGGV